MNNDSKGVITYLKNLPLTQYGKVIAHLFPHIGVCANWFGSVDWDSIPYESYDGSNMWGLTPDGCNSTVSEYGAYFCNVLKGSTFTKCNGTTPDCLNGECIPGKNYRHDTFCVLIIKAVYYGL